MERCAFDPAAEKHQSLAMLEYFVHLDVGDPPDDLVLAVAEVPDDLARAANWRESAAPPDFYNI
jgi:hypothetical protein